MPRVRVHFIDRSQDRSQTCSYTRPSTLTSAIIHRDHVSRTAAGTSSDAFESVPEAAVRPFGGGRGEAAVRCTIGRERAGQEGTFISLAAHASALSTLANVLFRFLQEFLQLTPENTVYKMIGPVLVQQDQAEAKSNVDKRLDFIRDDM